MSTPTPCTESIQIEIDLSASVMTDTMQAHLAALIGHLSLSPGALLVRPAGAGQWTGSIRFTDAGALHYEAAAGNCVEDVLNQLRERIGA